MFLGDIGGLQSIVFIIGFYLVASVSEQLYFRQIVSEVSHLDFNEDKEIS